MSVEASDVQTDEDCDELVDDSFSFSADFLEKRTRGKGSSMKPPSSPRSPYLSSLNMNPRRAAVAAWRLPRASLGDARGDARGDPAAESISARLTSLSNGHDISQALRPAGDVKATSNARKLKHLHSASNGFSISFSTSDHKDREDMYDEIIRLKKTLHAQKSDNQQMKAKLRRLEEDNAKREKQIEELLDPTKGNDYTRSLVDKKREGSVVVNGLKQRILKLEQQCREKENALSKLQSELRTTNLEELRITVDTYSEEIQRLRTLLYAAEKSSRAESKCSQRQQKALSSTVHRLTESVKQLQQENMSLREELNTDGPAGGVKGYREWSKQRLLRRLLELEKRAEDGRGSAHAEKSGGRLDREVQATPTEILWSTMATEAVVSVATMTEEGEELSDVREQLSQLEKERAELQEALARKDDEVKQLKTEREEVEKETERWKNKHMKEQDTERQQHQQQLQQLQQRIQNLEDQVHRAGADLSSELSSAAVNHQDGSDTSALRESEVTAGQELEEEEGDVETKKRQERRHKDRDRAAKIIQSNWRQHRTRDIVLLQSVLRGHVLRESQLRDLQTTAHNQSGNVARRSDGASSGGGDMDVVALTMIQSVFRGHMARCRLSVESSAALESAAGNSLRSLASRRVRSSHNNNRTGPSSVHNEDKNQNDGDKPRPISGSHVSGLMPTAVQPQLCCTDESGEAAAIESDDSDDIIVSPSRPLRSREVLML